MAESDSIKKAEKIKFKFCSICGDLKPNTTTHFHSTNGKIRHECLSCPAKAKPVYCFMCGKPMFGKNRYCLSCQRNKYNNGFCVSRQMPVNTIKKIRWYMGKTKDECKTKSLICSKCGLILPMDEFYYTRQNGLKKGFKSVCKKCLTGKFREIIPPRTKEEWLKIRKKQRRAPVKYESWADRLFADETREGKDGNLQAKCKYCDRWFYPTLCAVDVRHRTAMGIQGGEGNFYCSSGCKVACPTFGVAWNEREYKKGTSREANALLRKIVLNRDSHQCTKCGATGKRVELHCHHVMPATQNPMLANDPDNCVTLCRTCHVETHRVAGCGYYELRCG